MKAIALDYFDCKLLIVYFKNVLIITETNKLAAIDVNVSKPFCNKSLNFVYRSEK